MKDDYRFKHAKGRKIQVLFRGNEKWISAGTHNEVEATRWAEANKALYIKSSDYDPFVKDFAKDFWTRTDSASIRTTNKDRKHHYKEQYYLSKQGAVENYIIPAFGKYRLSQITSYMVDRWFLSLKRECGTPLADNTKNKILLTFSQMYDHAILSELCVSNPCEKVKVITEETKERLPMEEDEMKILFPKDDIKLLWVWGGLMWACYFSIMRCTGFRPGEVAGLKIENYYPDLYGVYTESSVDSFNKKIQKSIKTSNKGKKYKVGLLDEQTNRLLARYIETLPPERELLFMVNGGLLVNFTSNKHFVGSLKRAGIPLNGRSQYSLRHTFQTTIAGEIEREKLVDLMGHTKYREGYDHRRGRKKLTQLQSIKPIIDGII